MRSPVDKSMLNRGNIEAGGIYRVTENFIFLRKTVPFTRESTFDWEFLVDGCELSEEDEVVRTEYMILEVREISDKIYAYVIILGTDKLGWVCYNNASINVVERVL